MCLTLGQSQEQTWLMSLRSCGKCCVRTCHQDDVCGNQRQLLLCHVERLGVGVGQRQGCRAFVWETGSWQKYLWEEGEFGFKYTKMESVGLERQDGICAEDLVMCYEWYLKMRIWIGPPRETVER